MRASALAEGIPVEFEADRVNRFPDPATGCVSRLAQNKICNAMVKQVLNEALTHGYDCALCGAHICCRDSIPSVNSRVNATVGRIIRLRSLLANQAAGECFGMAGAPAASRCAMQIELSLRSYAVASFDPITALMHSDGHRRLDGEFFLERHRVGLARRVPAARRQPCRRSCVAGCVAGGHRGVARFEGSGVGRRREAQLASNTSKGYRRPCSRS